MKDVDFTCCPFIKERLCFLTYVDFCENATIIKINFLELSTEAKIFYKWYVYANIHMDEYHKNLIWEFLNHDDMEAYSNLIKSIKNYRVR